MVLSSTHFSSPPPLADSNTFLFDEEEDEHACLLDSESDVEQTLEPVPLQQRRGNMWGWMGGGRRQDENVGGGLGRFFGGNGEGAGGGRSPLLGFALGDDRQKKCDACPEASPAEVVTDRAAKAGQIISNVSGGIIDRTRRNLTGVLFGPSMNFTTLILQEDWALAALQCKLHPYLAARWLDAAGFFCGRYASSVLPIHQTCALRPPVEMVQTLVIYHPAGVKEKESGFGRLPLHIACRNGASIDVVGALLAYHPDATQEADKLQRVPLHYALKNDSSPDVIEALLGVYPDAVHRADHRGWIPLHVACSVGSELEVIHSLLEKWPQSVVQKTHRGSDPISCARMSNGHPNMEAIIELIELEREKVFGVGESYDREDNAADRKCGEIVDRREDATELIDLADGEESKAVLTAVQEEDLVGLGKGVDGNEVGSGEDLLSFC